MLLFLFLLVAGQACAEGSGQVLQIKNSKGETFSYKDRVAQEKEVFDIKDRFAIILKYALTRVAEVGSLSSGAKMVIKTFIKRVFTIFATNASFMGVIANLQI